MTKNEPLNMAQIFMQSSHGIIKAYLDINRAHFLFVHRTRHILDCQKKKEYSQWYYKGTFCSKKWYTQTQ